jgi:hypothetical protein
VNYNPYAAPQAGPQGPNQPNRAGGPPQPWDIGEVLTAAWESFKVHWGIIIGAAIVTGILSMVPGGISTGIQVALNDPHDPNGASLVSVIIGLVFSLIGFVVQSFLQIGLIRIFLTVARGQAPEFGTLFSGGNVLLPFLGMMFLMLLGIGFSAILLLIPAIILALGWSLARFYVVDQEMGPIEALKASWNATIGQKGALFLFGLVAFALGLAGLLACCVGAVVAGMVVSVAQAIIYLRLAGLAGPPGAAMAPPGGPPPPYGPPPGYGGPPPGYGPPQGGGGYGGPPGGGGGYGGPPGGGGYGPPGGGYGGPPGGAPPGYGPGGGGGYGR